jgi:alkylhydroperoxidase family enzyme
MALRIVYFMAKMKMGKVVSPLKVIYNRKPKFLLAYMAINYLLERNLSLTPSFRLMFQTFVSMQNGCSFCQDVRQALAVQQSIGLEKFQALKDFRTSPLFDEREKAAFAFVEEFATNNKQVSDETFENLKRHFSDTEIVEIVWVNAVENYFNSLLVPLRLQSEGILLLAEKRMRKGENDG